ncbi:hypothetical protein SAMN05421783_11383 [Thiocapsa roseopersicina]|uniref:Uncharacterized protein n=1 Tax=Thiocapsa roseopersicina TaxID=1058 RepID=A0A1H2YNZ6_THIRO|nr:hypothetical protein SAMN05421783_11383 [Thiocapsa roseopersicina]
MTLSARVPTALAIRRRVLRDLEHTPFIDSLRGSLRLDLR